MLCSRGRRCIGWRHRTSGRCVQDADAQAALRSRRGTPARDRTTGSRSLSRGPSFWIRKTVQYYSSIGLDSSVRAWTSRSRSRASRSKQTRFPLINQLPVLRLNRHVLTNRVVTRTRRDPSSLSRTRASSGLLQLPLPNGVPSNADDRPSSSESTAAYPAVGFKQWLVMRLNKMSLKPLQRLYRK